MGISIGKLAPQAVALAVVGYCVWPTLMELSSQPETNPPTKQPELTASLLTPAMPADPTRDPLERPAVAATAKAGAGKPTAGRTAEKPATAKPAGKPVDPLNSLVLGATLIMGEQRLAMINGRLYAAQDKLPVSGPSTPPLTIVSVLPYMVVLEGDGKTLELTYANVASPSGSSLNAGTPARPRAAGASGAKTASAKAKSGGGRSSKTGK